MAVETMRFVNIIGDIKDFDRIVSEYIIGSEIHLENVIDVLANSHGLFPFVEENPYKALLRKVKNTMEMFGIPTEKGLSLVASQQFDVPDCSAELDENNIEGQIDEINKEFNSHIKQRKELQDLIDENRQLSDKITPMLDLPADLKDLMHLDFIKMRYGRLPKDNYKKLEELLSDVPMLFHEIGLHEDFIYGIYFAPEVYSERIDSLFAAIYFEIIELSEAVKGTPRQILDELELATQKALEDLHVLEEKIQSEIEKNKDFLCSAYATMNRLSDLFDIRKFAAHNRESFCLAGWMTRRNAKEFSRRTKEDVRITVVVENVSMVQFAKPPSKLRNWHICKPFEKLVEMYGLPGYREIDPTFLFTATFIFMFGVMYGDVGHGFVLALAGVLLSRKFDLCKIFVPIGIVSMLFGVVYGSVFGFEEYPIHPLWASPMHSTHTINTILIYSVCFGAIIITLAMFLNIVNANKQKDYGRMLFSYNGIAGIVFYWAAIYAMVSRFLFGTNVAGGLYTWGLIVLPLFCMFFAKPLGSILRKDKNWFPAKKGEFFSEAFFELFEIILSYVTNTVSFVRIGAYALIHAGMLQVVFMFAGRAGGGALYLITLIFGNLLVICLEGVLVAIQVLRLEFYELFSRFYGGEGKMFVPYGSD